ncbi:hypothetical protein JOQ06_026571, partial [Pogonophryne albipinna]
MGKSMRQRDVRDPVSSCAWIHVGDLTSEVVSSVSEEEADLARSDEDDQWEGEVCCNYKEGLTKPTQPREKRESEASLLLTLRFGFNEDPLTSPQPAGVRGGCRCYRFP